MNPPSMDLPETANNSSMTVYVPDWASRLARLERIVAATKSYPYLPQGLAQVIETIEAEP